VTTAADGFAGAHDTLSLGSHAGDTVYYFALFVVARHLLSHHLPGTRRNEDWNGRIEVATLRPKDGESPEKTPRGLEAAQEDPAGLQISRANMRHGHDAVSAISGVVEPRSNKAR